MASMKKTLLFAVAVLATMPLMPAAALAPGAMETSDDSRDHVKAFESLKQGKIVPLAKILDWLQANYRGYVVEIELEGEETPPRYEVEFVTDRGDFLEFHFDATSGRMTKVDGDGAETARKAP